jgi:glutamyl-tRNA synthetase
MPVRVRFAPSPTGYLHLGGARSALFNFLFARKMGGQFLLRIEDTDRTRYNEQALHDLIRDLKWLGLDWDEGPGVGGPHGPYQQSERLDLYEKHAQILLDSGAAYRCFCTAERLAEVRKTQEEQKQTPGYDRHCRDLPVEESNERAAAGDPFVVRFRAPLHGSMTVHDILRGDIEYQNHVLDDLVLMKTDGFPTYHMASVVDDHDMEITHVLRGEEWLPSTPRHVLLYKAFGWEPPLFCHMPVILSPTGKGKLSKRDGAISVGDYRERGYLPQAMVNFLAFIGWSPGDEREKMPLQELIQAFNLEQITPKAAVFNETKLEWMNGQYLLDTPAEELVPEVTRLLVKSGYPSAAADQDRVLTHVRLLKDRSKRLDELVDTGLYFWGDPVNYEEKAWAKHWKPETTAQLLDLTQKFQFWNWTADALEELYRATAEDLGIKFAALIHPTRLAISGLSFGPGLFELMEALGKDTVRKRMYRAVQYAASVSIVQSTLAP